MYLDFFQLRQAPFQVTPNPDFLYLSEDHREALGALIYGVAQKKGFISLTGEVGVGKTTLVRAFLEEIDQEHTKVISLLNPKVAFRDLLVILLTELGANPGAGRGFVMVEQLQRALIEHLRPDCTVVLIIDEAQNMPSATLEDLRVLSNLETSTDKLLQIIFCGQPEFDERLARPELRQLKQRISVRAVVMPLPDAEAVRYIHHRLSIAGAPSLALFTPGAIRAIIREARGIPRLINILCDNALVTACGYQQRQVTRRIVDEIIADRNARARQPPGRRRLPALSVALGVATVALAAAVVFRWPIALDPLPATPPVPAPQPSLPATPPVASTPQPPIQPAPAPLPNPAQQAPPTPPPPVAQTAPVQEPTRAAVPDPATDQQARPRTSPPIAEALSAPEPVAAAVADPPITDQALTAATGPAPPPVEARAVQIRIVKRGDRLLDLIEQVYGVRDATLVSQVKQHNPQLKSTDVLPIGAQLVFPALDRAPAP